MNQTIAGLAVLSALGLFQSEWVEILSKFGLPTFLVILFLYGGYRTIQWAGAIVEAVGKWAATFFAEQQSVLKQNTETIREGFLQMKASIDHLSVVQEKRIEKMETLMKDKK